MVTLLLALALTQPIYPYDDTIAIKVNQASLFTWDAAKAPDSITSWGLKCRYGTEHVERSIPSTQQAIPVGDLNLVPGVYTHCGFTAINQLGESLPYPVPNFEYRYSYGPLARTTLELLALLASVSTLAFAYKRKAQEILSLVYTRVRKRQSCLPNHSTTPLDIPQKVRSYDSRS